MNYLDYPIPELVRCGMCGGTAVYQCNQGTMNPSIACHVWTCHECGESTQWEMGDDGSGGMHSLGLFFSDEEEGDIAASDCLAISTHVWLPTDDGIPESAKIEGGE